MPDTDPLPPAVTRTEVAGLPVRRGKVRDLYDLGDELVMVATDRVSAFDWVLPTGIPDKGRILTALSLFWCDLLGQERQLVTADVSRMPAPFADDPETFAGRTVLVRKAAVAPIECVVRGYLAGSGWKDYRRSGAVCGHRLPAGLVESAELPEPIFTPATKAMQGHDENISIARAADAVGAELVGTLRTRSLDLYRRAAEHARGRGVILADTKFEFGHLPGGELVLVDEALTPDSSRWWPADRYAPGGPQPSFDKQFVRDWLESVGFDKSSPPPPLPADVVVRTRAKYLQAHRLLTGREFGA